MDIEDLREYCLSKNAVTESFPFDEDTLVFKVGDKIFCLTDLGERFKINIKCDPEKGAELREENDEIIPGYHMNKKHWITVDLEGSLEESFIHELIDESYDLVVSKMSKNERMRFIL